MTFNPSDFVHSNDKNLARFFQAFWIDKDTTDERVETCLAVWHESYYIENGEIKVRIGKQPQFLTLHVNN